MKFTSACFLVGALALSGIPPLAGFFSKDAILASLWGATGTNAAFGWPLFIVGLMVAILSAFYMFRVYFGVFHGPERGRAHESTPSMVAPMVVLASITVVAGAINLPGVGISLTGLLEPGKTETLLPWLMALSTAAALGGVYVAWEQSKLRAALHSGKIAPPAKLSRLYGGVFLRPVFGISRFLREVQVDAWLQAIVVRPVLAAAELLSRIDIDGFYMTVFARTPVVVAQGLTFFDVAVIDRAVDGLGRAGVGGRGRLRIRGPSRHRPRRRRRRPGHGRRRPQPAQDCRPAWSRTTPCSCSFSASSRSMWRGGWLDERNARADHSDRHTVVGIRDRAAAARRGASASSRRSPSRLPAPPSHGRWSCWRPSRSGRPRCSSSRRTRGCRRSACSFKLGIDGLSLPLVFLATLLTFLGALYTWRLQQQVKAFCFLMLLLEVGMIGVFLALDAILFYVFWELVLVPMFFMIGIWGGERRRYASVKFFIYTLIGSVDHDARPAAALRLGPEDVRPAGDHRVGRGGQVHARAAVLDLRRALPRIRGEDPDLAVPHMAARRARRGSHGRQRAARRRPAQDGRLWVAPDIAVRPAGCVPRVLAVSRHARRHRYRLRGGGGA